MYHSYIYWAYINWQFCLCFFFQSLSWCCLSDSWMFGVLSYLRAQSKLSVKLLNTMCIKWRYLCRNVQSMHLYSIKVWNCVRMFRLFDAGRWNILIISKRTGQEVCDCELWNMLLLHNQWRCCDLVEDIGNDDNNNNECYLLIII